MQQLAIVGVAGGFMAALGAFLAGLLAIANRRLYVYEDPRVDEAEALLCKSNCGACGLTQRSEASQRRGQAPGLPV